MSSFDIQADFDDSSPMQPESQPQQVAPIPKEFEATYEILARYSARNERRAHVDPDYVMYLIERIIKVEAALTQARERIAKLEDIAQGVLDEYSECAFDENRPTLQYCFTHRTKRCTAKKTYEMARAALVATQPAKEGKE